MIIAKNIKRVARKHGLTMKEISRQLEILPNNLSRSINSSHLDLDGMEQIARVIGCEVKDFFVDEPETPVNEILCPHCGKPIVFCKPKVEKGGESM